VTRKGTEIIEGETGKRKSG
jgi:hypothetical protein